MATERLGAEIRGLTLTLDGEDLHANEHSPHDLANVLGAVGREAIIHAVEANYAHIATHNPGATNMRPSLHAITLGSRRDSILTPYGQRNRTSISRSIVELQTPYQDYWRTIVAHDFTPEIRRFSTSTQSESVALLLRNPETDPHPITPLEHLPLALGFLEPAATRILKPRLAEALAHNDSETYRTLWQELEGENEAAVDRQVHSFDKSVLPAAQIGLAIAKANLRVSLRGDAYLLDPDGYLADLTDAEEGACQYGLDEVSELLKTEIARVKQRHTG